LIFIALLIEIINKEDIIKVNNIIEGLNYSITYLYYFLHYDQVDILLNNNIKYNMNNTIEEASKIYKLINKNLFSLDYE
jgi:hypothetical protein